MERCPCGWGPGVLEKHYGKSPTCRPRQVPTSAGRDRSASAALFATRLAALLENELWEAHSSHFVSRAQGETMLGMVVSVVVLVIEFIMAEVTAEAALPGGLTLPAVLAVLNIVRQAFYGLRSAQKMIDKKLKSLLVVDPLVRRDVSDPIEYKKCVTFSIVQLLTVMLTANKEIRQLVVKASNKWKSGDLHKVVPAVYADVTDGRRFRHSDACKKEDFGVGKKLLWIEMHAWNDGMTSTDGMASKAKENKWEVILACLINLPLYMRHYFDHILLLALFQFKWGGRNGGILRVLCGIDQEGQGLPGAQDAINMRSEIKASKERKITINLPDDEDPSNEDGIDYILVLNVLLISLDWLANGAFGPFAEGVSARRPCFKCHWTDKCPCAWISKTDPRLATLEHTALCRGRRTRTHHNTLQVVREMRLLNPTALKAARTEEGIFSLHFASEYLLGDIVKDATVDIMHIFFSSGVVPYQLSWTLDIYIPAEFTYGALNLNVKVYNKSRKGHHIPKLARSGKDDRGAAKMSLTAAEAMEFTLGSEQIMGELVVDKTAKHWLAWLALVKLVRFILRRQYSSALDPSRVQVLYDKWMLSVEKVPQFKGRWKPKFHLGDHLKDALEVSVWGGTRRSSRYACFPFMLTHTILSRTHTSPMHRSMARGAPSGASGVKHSSSTSSAYLR